MILLVEYWFDRKGILDFTLVTFVLLISFLRYIYIYGFESIKRDCIEVSSGLRFKLFTYFRTRYMVYAWGLFVAFPFVVTGYLREIGLLIIGIVVIYLLCSLGLVFKVNRVRKVIEGYDELTDTKEM